MAVVSGFYGKLPGVGDFVGRRLTPTFVEHWDHWLQSSLSQSQIMLGDGWLDLYLTSPIWRFAVSAGLCGEQPWCGVMMPSVDSVGRYFPLTIGCPLPLDANLLQVVEQGQQWFVAAENILIEVLQNPQFNMEVFDGKVVALGGVGGFIGQGSATDIGFGTQWQLPFRQTNPSWSVSKLAHQMLLQRLSNYSVWWGEGSQHIAPSLLVCAAMPQAQSFSSMLNGQWQFGGWEQWQ